MTSSPEGAPLAARRHYIDWARGIAVLIMIHAHVLDAWTLPAERKSLAFGYLNVLGGFAAPLFLWLAGLSLMLSAARGLTRGQRRADVAATLMRRGAEIFVLAFIFRAQSFIVSPGNPLVSLLRVDILNIMGPSLVGAAFLWRLAPGQRWASWSCAAAGTAIALVTPLARTANWVSALPPALQWYITPVGNHSTFTLFPWAGFVFVGAATGIILASTGAREGRTVRLLSLAGFILTVGCYALSFRPSIYQVSSFWTTSPTYFGMRVGILMLALSALYAAAPVAALAPAAWNALARFGRHSLFVYWVHVELVYGYATAVLHHRLPVWGTGIAYVLFTVLMYASLDLRDRLVSWWSDRHGRPTLSSVSS
ncbi:MAG: heparan-alpha-glucosaminide N-acetyltransferase domain-containing protein [Vicinamibacterales bacterium]